MGYQKPEVTESYFAPDLYRQASGFVSAACLANDCTDNKAIEDPSDT